MPLSGPELGVRSPLKLRVGIDVPNFAGVNLQKDAAAIDPNQFQELINVRLRGEIHSRGGQAKITTAAAEACVIGVFDTGVEWVTQPHNGIYAVTGQGSDYYYNPDLSASTYNVSGLGTVSSAKQYPRRCMIAHLGGNWFIGASDLRRLTSIKAEPSTPDSSAVLESITSDFASMCSWDERLWIAESGGDVLVVEAGTVSTESSVGALHLLGHRDDLYAAGDGVLKKRDGGVWTSITISGEITGVFKPTCMVSDGVTLYVAGYDYQAGGPQCDPIILAYDVQTGTVSTYWSTTYSGYESDPYVGVTHMTIHQGTLFWAYPAEVGEGDIASYISSIDDDPAVIVDDIDSSGYDRGVTQLLSYDGELYAAVTMPNTASGGEQSHYICKTTEYPSGSIKYGDDVDGWVVVGETDAEVWCLEPIS